MNILFTLAVLIITVILISTHSWDVIKKLYRNYYESWETVFYDWFISHIFDAVFVLYGLHRRIFIQILLLHKTEK